MANNPVRIHPLVYFQKPQVGGVNTNEKSISPVQIIFPNGGFGLGIPVKDDMENGSTERPESHYTVIASRPEHSPSDNLHKNGLKLSIILLAIFNIFLTCIFYYEANTIDTSKVEIANTSGGLPNTFSMVSTHRSRQETLNFAATLVILAVGIASTLFEVVLGLSAFAFALALNFLLGTSSLSYFVYSFRYVPDIFLIYLALVLRSKLQCTFLPLLQTNNNRRL